MKIKEFRTLEEGILFLRSEAKNGPLSIGGILQSLSGKGSSLILMLLSIPFCQPIQIPGLSTPFGLVIAFIGLRRVFGKSIWLPRKIVERKIAFSTFEKITDNILRVVRKIKPFIHPRLVWICHSSYMAKANGLLISILGLFLALPLPIPFSNLTAAWAIFLIALGMLEDDGLLVLAGYLVLLITIVIFILLGLTVIN